MPCRTVGRVKAHSHSLQASHEREDTADCNDLDSVLSSSLGSAPTLLSMGDSSLSTALTSGVEEHSVSQTYDVIKELKAYTRYCDSAKATYYSVVRGEMHRQLDTLRSGADELTCKLAALRVQRQRAFRVSSGDLSDCCSSLSQKRGSPPSSEGAMSLSLSDGSEASVSASPQRLTEFAVAVVTAEDADLPEAVLRHRRIMLHRNHSESWHYMAPPLVRIASNKELNPAPERADDDAEEEAETTEESTTREDGSLANKQGRDGKEAQARCTTEAVEPADRLPEHRKNAAAPFACATLLASAAFVVIAYVMQMLVGGGVGI